MKRTALLLFLCLLPFALYHNNSGDGPDSDIYLGVAQMIMTEGHLNLLPPELTPEVVWQITPTNHFPLHQNIGGVVFFLPSTALALIGVKAAALIPGLPERLYDLCYQERLWGGVVAYVLALLSSLLTYRVVRHYFSATASALSLVLTTFGGPLFVYTAAYPCQMHLPAVFLAALLLYLYQFGNREQRHFWALLGAVFSFGVFVRTEFVVWGLLLPAALFPPDSSGRWPWRLMGKRLLLMAGGVLLFLVPAAMLRQVIFGVQGSSYGAQFDATLLKYSYLLLFGPRNGLFSFWPILLLALVGYFARFSRNPRLGHLLFAIVVLSGVIFGATIFWSDEMGSAFGQRRFLVVLPCFVFFLARLLELCRGRRLWVLVAGSASVFWALEIFCLYGRKWKFPDNTTGFLMANDYTSLLRLFGTYTAPLGRQLILEVFLPRHVDVVWLFPLFVLVAVGACSCWRSLRTIAFPALLVTLVMLSVALTLFLGGARKRGEAEFAAIARANPGTRFVVRSCDINDEILGSMVDCVAFFREIRQDGEAEHFRRKTVALLQREAPDQLENFTETVAALDRRQALGWYRLVPEQSHFALLRWSAEAYAAEKRGEPPPNVIALYRY